MISALATFIGAIIISLLYGWKIALVMISSAPFIAGTSFVLSKLMARHVSREQQAYNAASVIAKEAIESIQTVVAFGCEKSELQR